MKQRPKQVNCQNEPPYPNHKTILISIRYPDYYLEQTEGDKEINIKKFNPKERVYNAID